MNIQYYLQYATRLLSHLHNPKLDSEILLSYVLKKSRSWITVFYDTILSNHQIMLFKKLVKRRIQNEPIAYIIKKKEFWSLELIISKNVLIPRPETEILVEQSINRLKKKNIVLELGSGCGAISLAIGYEKPLCTVIGVDYMKKANIIANRNAIFLNLKNVIFYYSYWFSKINQKFHLIVTNPPYISKKDILKSEKNIFFEPIHALVSDNNGILAIEHIIKNAGKYLFQGGWLLIEHGWKQKKQIFYLFKKYNFYNVFCYKDYSGKDRVMVGRI